MTPEDKMAHEEKRDEHGTAQEHSADQEHGAGQEHGAAQTESASVDNHLRPIEHHEAIFTNSSGEIGSEETSLEVVSTEPPSENLHIAAAKLGLVIDSEKLDQMERYCRLLWEWNENINLTRHTNFDLFARRDLLDSWHLAQQLAQGEDVLDVGTGGGVPGIPLAILRPDLNVSLCDSVAKKSKVVDDMVMKLKLPVPVHAMRVQDVLEDWRYSSLVTRAVGSLTQLAGWLKDYWHCFDRMLAIKGPRWVEERGEARHRGLLGGIELRKLVSYNMPGTSSESVVLQLQKPRR